MLLLSLPSLPLSCKGLPHVDLGRPKGSNNYLGIIDGIATIYGTAES